MNKQDHIQEVTRIQRRYEKKYFPVVQKAIQSQVDDVIKTVERYGVKQGLGEAQNIVSSKIGGIIEALYIEVGTRFAKLTWSDLQAQRRQAKKSLSVKGFGFNADWVKFIKEYLFRFLLDKIVFELSNTTRTAILTVLSNSIEQGLGVNETVRNLKDLPISKTQAARIVRTEITRAANTGTMAASDSFEYEQTKEWMSAHDKRTRGQHLGDHASHIGLDGQVIDVNDYFTDPINGDQLMFPGDPQATAASTINCRCTIAVVAKIDSNGRLIPKK